jgi:hypothetical protein
LKERKSRDAASPASFALSASALLDGVELMAEQRQSRSLATGDRSKPFFMDGATLL